MKLDKIAETIVVEDKDSIMYDKLNKFYQNDTLVMVEYPNEKINWRFEHLVRRNVVCLEGLSPILKKQIKTYMRNELIRREHDLSDICDTLCGIIHAIPYLEKLEKEDILLCSDKELWSNYTAYLHHESYGTLRIEISSFLRRLKRFTKALQQMKENS